MLLLICFRHDEGSASEAVCCWGWGRRCKASWCKSATNHASGNYLLASFPILWEWIRYMSCSTNEFSELPFTLTVSSTQVYNFVHISSGDAPDKELDDIVQKLTLDTFDQSASESECDSSASSNTSSCKIIFVLNYVVLESFVKLNYIYSLSVH